MELSGPPYRSTLATIQAQNGERKYGSEERILAPRLEDKIMVTKELAVTRGTDEISPDSHFRVWWERGVVGVGRWILTSRWIWVWAWILQALWWIRRCVKYLYIGFWLCEDFVRVVKSLLEFPSFSYYAHKEPRSKAKSRNECEWARRRITFWG